MVNRLDMGAVGAKNIEVEPAPAERLLDRFGHHFVKINQELETIFSSHIPLIEEMGNHILLGQGKRLRPLLFVLACRLCNHRKGDIYPLSAIFECIHAASLLHDDVLDNAKVRRKRTSANHKWGNHAAILEGDFLYSTAFAIALRAGSLGFFRRLTDTTTQMAQGQILEMIHTHDLRMETEQYMEIIRSKTAVLISAACACGAIVSGSPPEAERALDGFGVNMGIAFQLMDDLLDYTGDQEVIGKPVGKDLREGKITLPLIHTLQKLNRVERKACEDSLTMGRTNEEDIRWVIDMVRNNGAPDRIRQESLRYANRATRCLDVFPDTSAKQNLLELNRYVIERDR
jgi:octaprenyl-diphosphate synthase